LPAGRCLMTYRERREARVERLRDWADKRQARANATLASHEVYRGDHAFNFQPGHIPERARVIAQADRAFESLHKAEGMDNRADNIESAMGAAIYSDDPDALEQLRARIADLEAERARIKAFNVSCRKGQRTLTLLDEKQLANYLSCAKLTAYNLGKHGEFPAYHLSNLAGNISRNRERLQHLERAQVAKTAVATAAQNGQAWLVTPAQWPDYVEVAFPAKPERELLDELRAAGFRWNRTRSAWSGRNDALPTRYAQERELPPVSDPSAELPALAPVDPDVTAAAPAFPVGISVGGDSSALDTWHDDGGRVWK
jgi:Domain of unknown function (DUF3560)